MHSTCSISIPKNTMTVRRTQNGRQTQSVIRATPKARRPRQPNRVTNAPLARSSMWKSMGTPAIRTQKNTVSITHDEVFAEVVPTSTALEVSAYPVNPAVGTIFPWLSSVAARYETYKFRNLSFEFRTNQPATVGGIVCMAFEADANDPAPTTMFKAESYHDAISDVVWNHSRLPIDLRSDDKIPSRKTRVGIPTAANYDLTTYDVGTLYVLTEGINVTAAVGRLVVHYTVDLFTHQVQDGVAGYFTTTAGTDSTHFFGTARTVDADAILPFTFTDAQVVTFNQQFEGIITIKVIGTVMSGDIAGTIAGPSGCVVQMNGSLGQTVNATATTVVAACRVRASPGARLSFAMTATTVSTVYMTLAPGAYGQI